MLLICVIPTNNADMLIQIMPIAFCIKPASYESFYWNHMSCILGNSLKYNSRWHIYLIKSSHLQLLRYLSNIVPSLDRKKVVLRLDSILDWAITYSLIDYIIVSCGCLVLETRPLNWRVRSSYPYHPWFFWVMYWEGKHLEETHMSS